MASDLFIKWLAHYDTIHRGYTPAGIANAVTATGGSSFPRMAGGYNLYRGVDDDGAIDYANPVGAAGRNATTIANFTWRPHAASTRYFYTIKAVGGGGVESAASLPARIAEFDQSGGLLGLRPNAPNDLNVSPVAGGKFLVKWVYCARFQEAMPAEFRLYHDAGTGTVDYQTVIAQVSYRPGRVHYSYTSAAFAHDARRIWSVRAVTAGSVDDGNVSQVFAWADTQAPDPHPAVRLARLDPEQGGW